MNTDNKKFFRLISVVILSFFSFYGARSFELDILIIPVICACAYTFWFMVIKAEELFNALEQRELEIESLDGKIREMDSVSKDAYERIQELENRHE